MASIRAPLGDAKTGDITIALSDSCNCCCFGSKPMDDTSQVYVNSKGIAEAFDVVKAGEDIGFAIRRSLSNLETTLQSTVSRLSPSADRIMEEIQRRSGVSLDPTVKIELTAGHIKRINAAVRDILHPGTTEGK